jgi:pilus assembly protein CpaC
MMRRRAKAVALACWLALWPSAFAHADATAQSSLVLAVGEQRVIASTGVASYSEGTRGVVDVRLTPDASAFVIVGQRVGNTSLLLLLDDGRERSYAIAVVASGALATAQAAPSVAARDNIRLDFYFVQISRDHHQRLGVAWPGSVGGTLSASFDLRTAAFSDANALVADQALPRLDMAQANGWAKLMREAAFVTANGSEAKLSGGGELNVPIAGGLSAGLKQITFGTLLQVLPRYDRESGRIELTIHADVSDLSSDGGTGVPGRVTSSLDSVVNLQLGQSVVLAGLRANSAGGSRRGLPWLSELPLLGGLFGSHEQRSENRELLVFIVPSVVDTISLSARATLERALRIVDGYTGEQGEASLLQRSARAK